MKRIKLLASTLSLVPALAITTATGCSCNLQKETLSMDKPSTEDITKQPAATVKTADYIFTFNNTITGLNAQIKNQTSADQQNVDLVQIKECKCSGRKLTVTVEWKGDEKTDGSVQFYLHIFNSDNSFVYDVNKCVFKYTAVNPSKVSSISLDKSLLTLDVNETQTLSASVLPETATDKSISWKISDTAVASITPDEQNNTCAVKGLKTGSSAVVTATTNDGSYNASCTIYVNEGTVHVSSVSLNKTTLNLQVGDSEGLVATILPINATDKTVTWRFTGDAITCTNGIVTAVKEGASTVTATTRDGSKTATCTVNVTSKIKHVESVSLDSTSKDLVVGQTQQFKLTPTVLPSDASNKNVYWTSSNPAIAAVTQQGVVTPLASGSSTISVVTVDGGYHDECEVTVTTETLTGNQNIEVNDVSTNYTPVTYTCSSSATWTVQEGDGQPMPQGTSTTFSYTPTEGFAGSVVITAKSSITGATLTRNVEVSSISKLDATQLALGKIKVNSTATGYVAIPGYYYSNNNQIEITTIDSSNSNLNKNDNITSLHIGKNISTITSGQITNCKNIESLTVDSANTKFTSRTLSSNSEISGVLSKKYDGTGEVEPDTLLIGCKNTVIPSTVTTIKGAFEGTPLTSITIPESVETVDEAAYKNSSVTTVTFAGSIVKTIGDSAFEGCTNLSGIDLPTTVTTIGSKAFKGCSSLTTFPISTQVQKIGSYAFDGCSSITLTMADTTHPWCFYNTWENIYWWEDFGHENEHLTTSKYRGYTWHKQNDLFNMATAAGPAVCTVARKTDSDPNIFPNDLYIPTCCIRHDTYVTSSIELKVNCIGNKAFSDKTDIPNVRSIIIPNSVTVFSNDMFVNLINVKDVYFLANTYVAEEYNPYVSYEMLSRIDNIYVPTGQSIADWLKDSSHVSHDPTGKNVKVYSFKETIVSGGVTFDKYNGVPKN